MNTANRFAGLTAEDMNYRASQGRVSKADLEEWAELQNPNLMSIRWYVAEYEGHRGDLVVLVPELRYRSIE